MAYQSARSRKMFNLVKSSTEADEFIKCSLSPSYFITQYVKIVHPLYGLIPFAMYPFQFGVLKHWMANRYSIMLKPRQMGITTMACAYILWFAMMQPHKKVLLISIKANVAKAALRKIKKMYEYLPDFLKMEVVNGSKGAGDVGTITQMTFANGSEIIVSSATEDAGRSEAVSLLVLDEVAFQRYASMIWGAAQPTLSTGGGAILMSTAFGVGNFFHRTWVNAVTRKNEFYPIKLDWRMHPDRDDVWYQEQFRNLGEKRTMQEIDCNFLKSGYNVFNLEKIKAIEDRLNEQYPIEVLHGGDLLVYHLPVPGEYYFVGADVASGKDRNNSAFSIMDARGKEMACFKSNKIGVREFAHLLIKWGIQYNTAMIAPEINAIGEGIMAMLQEYNYPNLFNGIKPTYRLDEFDRRESPVFGWMSTGKSRHEMIQRMDDDLEEDLVELWNPFFVQEAYTFIYNEMNKPIALGKELKRGGASGKVDLEDAGEALSYDDDSIIGACITNFVRNYHGQDRIQMPLSGGGSR